MNRETGKLSRHGVQDVGLAIEESFFDSRQRQDIFLHSESSRQICGSLSLLVNEYLCLIPVGKVAGCEAEH